MRGIWLIVILILLCSCSDGYKRTLTKSEKFDIIFDEFQGVGINVTGSGKIIPIGHYYNKYHEPPYQVQIDALDSQNFVIALFRNNIDMGVSQDYINVFEFNLSAGKVSDVFELDKLAMYDEDSGMDTLSGVRFYDYKLVKTKKDKAYQIEVAQYRPFKYEDEIRNTDMKYVTEVTFFDSSIK